MKTRKQIMVEVATEAAEAIAGSLQPGPCDCKTIGKILECLSECEWALTQAINHNKVGWTAVFARDKAREMLKRCAESPNVD